MTNINSPEQQIQLERKRLILSDIVLHKRQETLQRLCDSFHFDNADLLDIEFKNYLQQKASFDKAYSTIASLTSEQIESLMPHIQVGHTIVQKCQELAEQKERQEKREKNQKRLNTVRRILAPLAYLALLRQNKKRNTVSKTLPSGKQQTETR